VGDCVGSSQKLIVIKEVKVQDHTRTEMRVWIGFVAGSSIAFLITVLFSERMTADQIEVLWLAAMAIGYINHSIWHHETGVIVSSSLGLMVALLSLVLVPFLVPVGWIVLGLGLAISGFYNVPRTRGHSGVHGFVGVYIALGGLFRLLSLYLQTSTYSVYMVWMVLIGLVYITVARGIGNPVMHFLGAFWILASVVSYAFCPQLMTLSVGLVFAIGVIANFVYLYRLLGRTPKLGELFSIAGRALFPKGLKKPIDQYRVLAILIRDIGAEDVIWDLMSHLEPRCTPILLLGPTAPTQLPLPKTTQIGWVTTISGVSKLDYTILSPEDPTMVNMFLNKTLGSLSTGTKPVILGDFLDNMIPHMDEGLFYKYYSDLASATRVSNHTVIFIVNADIHSGVEVNVVKRFADVIIENREREERGRLVREVRVSNRVDEIHTDWERY
jgi:hypothetical protein